MAKLVLSLNDDILGYHFLEKERFTIGRKPTNDLHIDDASVSKEHAAIITVGNDQIIEDLGSTNGTVVNGRKIGKHILQNNDTVEIGRYQLRYINQKAKPGVDFDRTIMMMPVMNLRKGDGSGNTITNVEEPAGKSVGVARAANNRFPLGEVKVLAGSRAGETIELGPPLTIFGKEGVQLAVINRRPQGYTITHVDGKKHPVVNHKTIGEEAYLLSDGDEIEIGSERLRFAMKKA